MNKCLPYMFEKIDNYTELLFPSGLLKADSVIGKSVQFQIHGFLQNRRTKLSSVICEHTNKDRIAGRIGCTLDELDSYLDDIISEA